MTQLPPFSVRGGLVFAGIVWRVEASMEVPFSKLPYFDIDFRCQCGRPVRVPIRSECHSPVHVMAVEKENCQLRKLIEQYQEVLIELAGECVEAGVKPAFLQRAEGAIESIRSLINKHKNDQIND